MAHKSINPQELAMPKGYSHGVLADAGGRTLCVAAQLGWDGTGKIISEEMSAQFRQALKNVGSILRQSGANPDHILRVQIYIVGKQEYLRQVETIGKDYRQFMGKHSPTMTLAVVNELLEQGAKIQIEVTASIPEKTGAGEFQRHGQGGFMGDAPLRRGPPQPGVPVKK
jgi:enamine deaminase RidA (YjgF/YER057c/UK114 family)